LFCLFLAFSLILHYLFADDRHKWAGSPSKGQEKAPDVRLLARGEVAMRALVLGGLLVVAMGSSGSRCSARDCWRTCDGLAEPGQFAGYYPTCWRQWPMPWGCPTTPPLPKMAPPASRPPESPEAQPAPGAPAAQPDAASQPASPTPANGSARTTGSSRAFSLRSRIHSRGMSRGWLSWRRVR